MATYTITLTDFDHTRWLEYDVLHEQYLFILDSTTGTRVAQVDLGGQYKNNDTITFEFEYTVGGENRNLKQKHKI